MDGQTQHGLQRGGEFRRLCFPLNKSSVNGGYLGIPDYESNPLSLDSSLFRVLCIVWVPRL